MNLGFERIPDTFWNKNDTHTQHHFPVLNDRLVFLRYAKINLQFLSYKTDDERLNETMDYYFYSSNVDCSDQILENDFGNPECFETTFLQGTQIDDLKDKSSR